MVVVVVVLEWYFGALPCCVVKVTRCYVTLPQQKLLHPPRNKTCWVQEKQGCLQPLFVNVESGRLLTKERLPNCPFPLPEEIQKCSKKLWIAKHPWSGFTSVSAVLPLQVPEPIAAHASKAISATCLVCCERRVRLSWLLFMNKHDPFGALVFFISFFLTVWLKPTSQCTL